MNAIEPNYEIALRTLHRIEAYEWVGSLDPAEPENDTGNHFFAFGFEEYSAWQLERSGAWIVEMSPTVAGGEVVGYKIVEIEKID